MIIALRPVSLVELLVRGQVNRIVENRSFGSANRGNGAAPGSRNAPAAAPRPY